MGIIRATLAAMGGALADTWQEVIEAEGMSDTTVCSKGVRVRKGDRRDRNRRGTEDLISNGSIIHVYPGQCMLLLDGGKIVDFTAEEGYFKVDNSSTPSLFAGQFGESLREAFARVKYGGVPSAKQKVIYLNLQEIKGIKFGTKSPVNYFDNFYNSELFLRAHGTYSIKITNPIQFYTEVIPKDRDTVDIADVNLQYLSEFLEALQSALNQMSVDGIRISHVASRGRDLSRYMAQILDEDWKRMRGMEVQSVGIASISYDEESQKLINMRNQGAMLGDPSVREGYVQGAIARGFESAGSNPGGATGAFVGMGMGMGATGGFFGAASETNRRQMENERKPAPSSESWTCACGTEAEGNFCQNCGAKKPASAGGWTCACGTACTGNFCPSCGAKRPQSDSWTCACGTVCKGNFCPSCGARKSGV